MRRRRTDKQPRISGIQEGNHWCAPGVRSHSNCEGSTESREPAGCREVAIILLCANRRPVGSTVRKIRAVRSTRSDQRSKAECPMGLRLRCTPARKNNSQGGLMFRFQALATKPRYANRTRDMKRSLIIAML